MVLGCIDVMGEYLIRHHRVLTTLVKLTEKLGMQKFNVSRCGSQVYPLLTFPFKREVLFNCKGVMWLTASSCHTFRIHLSFPENAHSGEPAVNGWAVVLLETAISGPMQGTNK